MLCGLAAGCSSAEDLRKLCIPTVDCAAIDTIEAPANCSTCLACQDNWGACSPEGLACKRGSLDLDPDVPGCESATSDAQGQWLMRSTNDPLSFFSLNGGRFTIPISVSVLALDKPDPNCIPTLELSCAYTVQAMQLHIPDFAVPESSWRGGVATLNGPVAAMDDGTGIGVSAPLQFAFEVQQETTRRIALSVAPGQFRINLADPQRASILLRVDSIDFGGYQVTELFLNEELTVD